MSDTRTPVAFAVASMIINLLLSLALVKPFGINGIAFALSAATIVEFGLLWRTLAHRLDGFDLATIAGSLARTLVATVLMAETVALWLAALELAGLLDLGQKLDSGLAVIGGCAIGGAVFFYASRLLGSEEAGTLVERLPVPERIRPYLGR
jgi:putative peptidoglycan lipid II flippase